MKRAGDPPGPASPPPTPSTEPGVRRYAGPAAIAFVAVVAALVAVRFWQPAPPKHVAISTGPAGGAYPLFAERYRADLEQQGVTLELRPSSGAVENLGRLRAPAGSPDAVDVAIVQGGLPREPADAGLRSLGNLFLEPVWLFAAGPEPVSDVRGLAGRRVAVGVPGSGTHTVATAMMRLYRMDGPPTRIVEVGGEAAARGLRDGALDAVFFVGEPESPTIDSLLRDPRVRLVDMPRADAYARREPYLSRLVLPAGVIDPAADLPPKDVTLVATTAALVARQDLHPVIADLLVDAARRVHQAGTLLAAPGTFPNAAPGDFPLSPDAERYYRDGPGLLRRWLPLWTAVWVQRLLFVGIPLLAVIAPLVHFAPMLWTWQMRRRIYRWYGELKLIEHAVQRGLGDPAAQIRRLDAIDEHLRRLRTPNSFGSELYALRSHVLLVRDLLDRGPGLAAERARQTGGA